MGLLDVILSEVEKKKKLLSTEKFDLFTDKTKAVLEFFFLYKILSGYLYIYFFYGFYDANKIAST